MKNQPSKNQDKAAVRKTVQQGIQFLFFLLLMLLTYYTVFRQNHAKDILTAVKTMHPLPLLLSVFCAFFFVCAEGFMICVLRRKTSGCCAALAIPLPVFSSPESHPPPPADNPPSLLS